MKKIIRNLVTTLILTNFLSACLSIKPNISQSDKKETTTAPRIELAPEKTETIAFFINSDRPILLIQTNFETFQFLDIQNDQSFPFYPPGKTQQIDLKKNISPSGSLMLFPINDQEVIVTSLISGNVITTFDLQDFTKEFSPELAVEEAQKTFPDLSLTVGELENVVKKSITTSRLNFKWFINDRFLLFAKVGDKTSTNLHLFDLQSGTEDMLEKADGIVEDYWVSPDSKRILIKKGVLIDPYHWQDDRYYLLNMEDRNLESIQIPDDADMPSISWFSPEYIGIIHQPKLVGGINFSLLDINTMESHLIISDTFTGLYSNGETLFTIHQDNQTTELIIRDLTGETTASKEVDDSCYTCVIVNQKGCLLTCETKSLFINLKSLSVDSFDDPIQTASLSPDRNLIVLINRQYQASLCEPDLMECQKLVLDSEPLEILWLPDSSGFLYRASSRLAYYNLESNIIKPLLSSDLFSDYRNLNAVWVNFYDSNSKNE